MTLLAMSRLQSKHFHSKQRTFNKYIPTRLKLNSTKPTTTAIRSPPRPRDNDNTVYNDRKNGQRQRHHPRLLPPTIPGHICDWTVTSVIGEPPNSLEFSQWLGSLPSRIETVSVLNTIAFGYIVKALVALWVVGSWCRFRRGLATYQQGEARLMLDAGVALAVYLLARNEMLKTCIAVVAY
jgi:hypothetical protein